MARIILGNVAKAPPRKRRPRAEKVRARAVSKPSAGDPEDDRVDTVRLAEDGRRVPASLTVSPIRDADASVVGVAKVAHAPTPRKSGEGSRNSEAAPQARTEAESPNRKDVDALEAMSDDVRAPMTGMAGMLELLSRSGELTPEQRRYIALIKTANAALLTAVGDILECSKPEGRQFDLNARPFCVANLIYECMAITHPAAAVNGVLLRYNVDREVGDRVLGDEARLRQVLFNLLSNAIKFAQGGAVSVDVQSQRSPDGRERLLFSIADTGVGIPGRQQAGLFEGDGSAGRGRGGTGLATCKRLVTLMDGDIGVISGTGRGATFWFTAVLPATAAPAVERVFETAREPQRRQKGRILLVDDVETNLEIVGCYLEDDGYDVARCDSAARAIALLQTTPIDLVLMDIQMPVVDGVTATTTIRAMGAPIGDIPIIALTGNVLPRQIRSFLEAGMNDHVSKPIERAHLCNTIGIWLAPRPVPIAPTESSKPDFNRDKCDELVANFGSAWVAENAAKFASVLEGCFRSTPDAARREAHQILNFAGLLGFERLVELCREVENAPEGEPSQQLRQFNLVRRAQATAVETLRRLVIPEARARLVVGAFSQRGAGKNIAAA
jgi:signal transduction histidine kinase/CheY-like chemotaxis protein